MNQAIENKFKAFLLHAFISAIFVFGLYIVTQQWYPSFYFNTLGILPIFLITLITNIFIFPLFTLIVYKKNKPKLLFDLTVIILLQITAFIYSVYTIHSERPLFLVYSIDRFVVVTANSINIKEVKNPEFLLNSPQVLAAAMPKEKSLQSELLISVISGGPDIEYQPGLYEPLINQKKLFTKDKQKLHKYFMDFEVLDKVYMIDETVDSCIMMYI